MLDRIAIRRIAGPWQDPNASRIEKVADRHGIVGLCLVLLKYEFLSASTCQVLSDILNVKDYIVLVSGGVQRPIYAAQRPYPLPPDTAPYVDLGPPMLLRNTQSFARRSVLFLVTSMRGLSLRDRKIFSSEKSTRDQ